jgi:hypothetical protein
MPDAFIIEISGLTAGVATSHGRGFRLQASNPALIQLDGRTFKTIEAVKLGTEQVVARRVDHAMGRRQVLLRKLY